MKKKEQMTAAEREIRQAYTKQIAGIVLCLILSLSALVAATVAWFASNRNVQSSGMTVQVDPLASLVIAKDPNALKNATGVAVSFDSAAANLSPATHHESETCVTNLQYNTNPSAISPSTGYAMTSQSAQFADVPEKIDSEYYRDYVVYIAAIGKEFTSQDLTATMELNVAAEQQQQDYMMASTIDFYIDDAYKATLNAANGATAVTLISGGEIPLCTADHPIKVTMRCYFDGALEKSQGTAYVRTENLSTADFTIGVTFHAPEAAASP